MTNTDTYYEEATPKAPKAPLHQRSNAALQRLRDKTMSKLDDAGLNRRNLERTARKTASSAKRHAVPLTIGAIALGVGAALLINKRTRSAGLSLGRRAIERMR
jgi:PIN domain nuclease of toxin-antitoxin system